MNDPKRNSEGWKASLGGKVKGWVAGISAEVLDASAEDPEVARALVSAREQLENAYRQLFAKQGAR